MGALSVIALRMTSRQDQNWWEIANIKVRLLVPVQSLEEWITRIEQRDYSYQRFHNFIQVKLYGSLRISVFAARKGKLRQTVNLTGARTKLEVIRAQRKVSQFFGFSDVKLIVDSLTVKGGTHLYGVGLVSLIPKIRRSGFLCSYNTQKIAGLHIQGCVDTNPSVTIIWYQSGRYIVFGCQSPSQCRQAVSLLEKWSRASSDP